MKADNSSITTLKYAM